MREACGDRDLTPKTLCADRGAEVFVKNLDGYAALVFDVTRKKDSGHSALSQLTLYVITITESSLQSFEQLIQIEYPFGGRCQRIQ